MYRVNNVKLRVGFGLMRGCERGAIVFLEIHPTHKIWIIMKWNQVMNISRVPNSRDEIWEFSSLEFRPNFINLSVLFRIPISNYYWAKTSTLSKYKIFMQFHAVSHEICIYYIQIRYKMRILIENKIFRTLFRTWFGVAHRSWFRINLTFNTYPA